MEGPLRGTGLDGGPVSGAVRQGAGKCGWGRAKQKLREGPDWRNGDSGHVHVQDLVVPPPFLPALFPGTQSGRTLGEAPWTGGPSCSLGGVFSLQRVKFPAPRGRVSPEPSQLGLQAPSWGPLPVDLALSCPGAGWAGGPGLARGGMSPSRRSRKASSSGVSGLEPGQCGPPGRPYCPGAGPGGKEAEPLPPAARPPGRSRAALAAALAMGFSSGRIRAAGSQQ